MCRTQRVAAFVLGLLVGQSSWWTFLGPARGARSLRAQSMDEVRTAMKAAREQVPDEDDDGLLVDDQGLTYARFQGGSLVDADWQDEQEEAPRQRQVQGRQRQGQEQGDFSWGPATASKTKWRRPPADGEDAQDAEEEQEWFVGQVKSYAPSSGYGFIECEDTYRQYGTDVFLHKTQVEQGLSNKARKGDAVRFCVTMNKAGRPQALAAEPFVATPFVAPTRSFVGRVKRYNAAQGFGFIACEETQSIFNSDVFLHKQQFEDAGLKLGTQVTFSVEVSARGQPQARNVTRADAGDSDETQAEDR